MVWALIIKVLLVLPHKLLPNSPRHEGPVYLKSMWALGFLSETEIYGSGSSLTSRFQLLWTQLAHSPRRACMSNMLKRTQAGEEALLMVAKDTRKRKARETACPSLFCCRLCSLPLFPSGWQTGEYMLLGVQNWFLFLRNGGGRCMPGLASSVPMYMQALNKKTSRGKVAAGGSRWRLCHGVGSTCGWHKQYQTEPWCKVDAVWTPHTGCI